MNTVKEINNISQIPNTFAENRATHFIAIIGGGPKGLYALERLAAQFQEFPTENNLEIHIFNKTPAFGSGEIYDPVQPDYLLINFCIGNINMWIDEEPPAVTFETLSLTEWLRRKTAGKVEISEKDYVPRGIVGEYLQDGFKRIVQNLPQNLSVKTIVGEVYDIDEIGSEFVLKLKKDGKIGSLRTKYQNIILTTGHTSRNQTETEKSYREFTKQFADTSFVPFVYPVENLQHIPAKSSVAIKGLGLTFVDTVLALTVGRGGKFERDSKGKIIKYVPSGNEPKVIYPFSRSGIPILPRGAFCGKPDFALRFFTKEKISEIRKHSSTPKLDFERDLWTLVEREMIFAYYRVLMENKDFTFNKTADFEDFVKDIQNFHAEYRTEKRFDLSKFFDPLKNSEYHLKSHKKFIENYIAEAIRQAKNGEDKSPWMAVVAVWREITPIFGEIYNFAGLTPASHKKFLEEYIGMLCRISFGPPIESMEKIPAIAEAGILSFEIGAEPQVFTGFEKGFFNIKSKQNGFECEVKHLIDARIPKNKIPQNASPLYKNLLEKGSIKTFSNGDFNVGCLEVSEEGFVKNAKGRSQKNFAAYGTPTEGITFDNDSLSRRRNNFASIWAENIRREISVK